MIYKIRTKLTEFFADKSGATAIEYALLASALGLAIFGSTQALAKLIVLLFQDTVAANI